MALWTQKYIDSLPDSSFAFISPGGAKDADGKTTPRSLRHLPYKDTDGDDDHDHIANALARLDQTEGIPTSEKPHIRAQLEAALQKTQQHSVGVELGERLTLSAAAIKLDANGELPTRLPLFTTFNLPHSIKGNFSVEVDDLRQMKDNFDAGVGFPTNDASTGLPIDFEHKWLERAAGWIKGLELAIDPTDDTKATLYANPVEWTDEGAEAVRNGRYKMISPMGSFGKKDGKLSLWANVNNLKEKLANVLEGAGLTNAPFQRGMSPIRAAAIADEVDAALAENKVVFVISDSQQQIKEKRMNIDEVRLKDREALSVPELDFLAEHREQLSADDRKKFQLEDTAANKITLSAEDQQTLADIREGRLQLVGADKTVVEKETLDRLQSSAEQYRTEKAEAIVDGHIRTGKVKMDARDFWVKQLLDTSGDARKALEDQLAALPSHELLGKTVGSAEEVDNDVQEELKRKTLAVQKEAKESGSMLTYAQAQDQVLRDDKAMKQRVEAAREGN